MYNTIHTYNWHNYRLLVLGHSDVNHRCTATILAVGRSEDTYVYSGVFAALVQRGYRPKYVLGDGAGSITAATKRHFEEAVRLMCFPHLIRRFDIHSKSLPPELAAQFRHDLCLLQYCRNELEFQRRKHCDGADANVDGSHAPSRSRLVAYFRKTWLESDLSKWSEGESPYCLNNNGAESVNLHIKNDHTIRKVQAFAVFLGKDVPTKPDIPLKVFKEAHKPQKECEDGKRVYCERTGQSEYIFSSTQVDLKTPQDVYREYERSFHQSPESWEEYLETRFSVCVVKPAVLGPFFACSCPSGSKKEHASTQLW
ncbi:hypothetical protein AAVH_28705 [Aphelenchoides avenae]|nr:hypothetical protein AAVH_28705 [Aphelenchus avenae]